MRFPGYACSSCGTPSSRRWNLQRHIAAQHGGMGYCLHIMDYISGRQVYIRSLLAPRQGKNLSCRFSMCGAESLSRRTPGRKPPDSTQLVILLGVKMLRTRYSFSDRSTRKGPSCHICEECLQIYLLSFTNKLKPQVINHKCILENLVKALILSEKQKSDKLREGHIQIPLHIRDLIIHNSKDGLIFLNAIRDPSDTRSNKIKSIPPNQYDWSSRAIKGGCTTIDHKELTEFLIQANPFSFGVFNLSDGETPVYYLMVVSIYTDHITAKSFSWFNCSLRVDANLLLFRSS